MRTNIRNWNCDCFLSYQSKTKLNIIIPRINYLKQINTHKKEIGSFVNDALSNYKYTQSTLLIINIY